jgi:hypothetical protein
MSIIQSSKLCWIDSIQTLHSKDRSYNKELDTFNMKKNLNPAWINKLELITMEIYNK